MTRNTFTYNSGLNLSFPCRLGSIYYVCLNSLLTQPCTWHKYNELPSTIMKNTSSPQGSPCMARIVVWRELSLFLWFCSPWEAGARISWMFESHWLSAGSPIGGYPPSGAINFNFSSERKCHTLDYIYSPCSIHTRPQPTTFSEVTLYS